MTKKSIATALALGFVAFILSVHQTSSSPMTACEKEGHHWNSETGQCESKDKQVEAARKACLAQGNSWEVIKGQCIIVNPQSAPGQAEEQSSSEPASGDDGRKPK